MVPLLFVQTLVIERVVEAACHGASTIESLHVFQLSGAGTFVVEGGGDIPCDVRHPPLPASFAVIFVAMVRSPRLFQTGAAAGAAGGLRTRSSASNS